MRTAVDEHVVLLDGFGRTAGTIPKHSAHSSETPLHLAFSCYVVHGGGGVLLARRATTKRTWPGVWSNACCGHPQDGERLRDAITRRLEQELGLRPVRLSLVVPDFTYRATMADGTVEHEVCPVVVAEVAGAPCPDPREVDELAWTSWAELQVRAQVDPDSLSPWCVAQVRALAEAGWAPGVWPAHDALRDAAPLFAVPAPTSGSVDPLAPVAAPVAAVLDRLLAEKTEELTAIDTTLRPVVDEIRALVDAGGKRLRPAFVHWGHRAAGGLDLDGVADVGAAVELLHTFALLHDDVMDRSAHRRGRDAAHVAFAAHHARTWLAGDADWFGTSAAVLAGDLVFVWADEVLDGARLPADALERARRVFSTLRCEVMAGQYLDLLHAADPAADEVRARHVALLKSARYTVTRPLELGAAVAGVVDGPVLDALRAYGDAVGLAFQLRDDVLGLFGDPEVTGKSALDDLREGKRTVLVLRAHRLASATQRAVLDDALGDPTLDECRADAVRAVVADTGALASVELLVTHLLAVADAALDAVPQPARGPLRAMAAQAARRQS
jgi:geranylgeranyl diphosphate synthase type I